MNTMMNPNKYFLIIALDFNNPEIALEFARKIPKIKFFKIGMELFYSEGPSIIEKIKNVGKDVKVFLDLKINDIPKTIEKSVARLCSYGPDYITVFCNSDGVKAAREGCGANSTKILNVTVLTSEVANIETVKERALLSYNSGAHGIICSGLETAQVRQIISSPEFIIVNPGIRLYDANDDQQRIVTPMQAYLAGATNIVVGRPITLSKNPVAMVDEYFTSFAKNQE